MLEIYVYIQNHSLTFNILAGTPATTQLSGTSLVTTLIAPIVTLSPICTGPKQNPHYYQQ